MTITTSVDATWRVGRVEIDTPHDAAGTVRGVTEVTISEPSGQQRGGRTTYGAIPGEATSRNNADVMDDEVEVAGGTKISWRLIMEAMPLFIEKWRMEDIENPPARMIPQRGMQTTPVPELGPKPVGPEGLPPPRVPPVKQEGESPVSFNG
jgi:hypothetical protein